MVPRMPGVSLGGVFAPVVSTFDAGSGGLDGAAFRRNVRAHLGAGLAGVVVAGSSGEAALLDEDERRTLVAWARDAAGAAPVIAGVGAESTRATVRRAREAAEAGADLVLVVAPHYYGRRMTDEALYAHFAAVADASPRPVLLYNIPVYAHLVLSPALVARLSAHPNVAGMKDSAGDLATLARYAEARGPGFALLTGHAGTLEAALGVGLDGAILAAALFAPAHALALVAAHRAGRREEAAAAQAALLPLARDIVAALGPAGLKCAMDLCGLAGGTPRPPLRSCDAEERRQVAAALAAAGIAPGSVAPGSGAVLSAAGTAGG
jgi:4-hydroxy-2-oxoglutarate aldolase